MRLQFLRNRGLGPKSLRLRFRDRWARREISPERRRRFLADIESRAPALPAPPPTTIAVVVPCYRHAAYLPQALESLAAQTRPPDEVVFVDDASPDGSAEIVREFLASTPWLAAGTGRLLVNERNGGQAASLNRAIEATGSDLVMVLNDDDYLMHDAVETMLGYFSRHPEAGIIGARHVSFAGDGALREAAKSGVEHAADDGLIVRRPEDVARLRYAHELDMTHSGQTVRRAAWEGVGGYLSDRGDRLVPFSDRDFQLRVALVWPSAVAESRPLAFWRNDSSVDRRRHS